MKVTTDGCLFGAIAASEIAGRNIAGRLLDIGAGTGLLSLMIVQQNLHLEIDAIEIDDQAARQVLGNVALSPFKNQINIVHADVKEFYPPHQYDVIISNPPFYKAHLKSPDQRRNRALHDASLNLENLLQQMIRMAKQEGTLGVLLPVENTGEFVDLANEYGWNCYRQIAIRQTENHRPFRKISFFKKQPHAMTQEDLLTIREKDAYSESFISYLKNYYLDL